MIEQGLEIRTPDGTADALLVRPDSRDALPAVINLTDGLGFRQAFADQSKRIAERGYVVLTPNIFYRTSKPPVFDFEPDFANAASFHGGGLFTDTDESPHLLLPRVKARLYFGHAENDQGMPAAAIEKLESALEAWGGGYESETYTARHGWMISGGKVHSPAEAERGFAKLMELFDNTLRSPAGVGAR
jgi:dienelactone hydrolase